MYRWSRRYVEHIVASASRSLRSLHTGGPDVDVVVVGGGHAGVPGSRDGVVMVPYTYDRAAVGAVTLSV